MELNKATVNIESTASVWDFLKYTALEGVETNIYFTFFQLQTHNTNQNTTTSASFTVNSQSPLSFLPIQKGCNPVYVLYMESIHRCKFYSTIW